MFSRLIIISSLTALLATGCGGTRENDPIEATSGNLDLALQQAIDNAIIPAVDGFKTQAEGFQSASDGFCSAKNDSSLELLQQQWKTLNEQWFKLANYHFGPPNDDLIFPKYTFINSLRLRGTDYLETVRTEIANNMTNSVTLDDAFFGTQTFQKVGLLALESSIFETASGEQSKVSSDIVNEYANNARKCEILSGLAGQISQHASYIQTGWKTNFKESGTAYRTQFLGNQLADGTAPLTLLITSVQEHLDYLQARNVATTAAKLSGHAWQSISKSIDEVELLLEGSAETTVSFFAIMESAGYQNSVASVKENITEVRTAITDRDAPMLEIALGKLDGNFKREIPDGLNVQLGINFSDGD